MKKREGLKFVKKFEKRKPLLKKDYASHPANRANVKGMLRTIIFNT